MHYGQDLGNRLATHFRIERPIPLHDVRPCHFCIHETGIAASSRSRGGIHSHDFQSSVPTKAGASETGERTFRIGYEAIQQNKEFPSKLLGLVPQRLGVVCGVVFIYAFINFALFIALMEGGSPTVKNGRYYLDSHGQKIRDITEEEYQRFLAYEVRGFSGHWMLFSIVPMVYFLTVHPKLHQTTESELAKAS